MINEYLHPPKEDYIANFSLREPLRVLLLEAIDREIISHDIHTVFHAGRVDNGENPAPICYDDK
jgi:hypothetical protein